jgi:hypothetical protein
MSQISCRKEKRREREREGIFNIQYSIFSLFNESNFFLKMARKERK